MRLEENVERGGEFTLNALVLDVELLEEDLVEEPSNERRGAAIGGLTVAGEIERTRQVGLDKRVVVFRLSDLCRDAVELSADALLLDSE